MNILGGGGTGQNDQQIAKGLHVSGSLYGQTIAMLYGRDRVTPQMIYGANFNYVKGVTKKGTNAKGRLTGYYMDADFLLGYGPMQGINSVWFDKGNYHTGLHSQTFTGGGTNTTFSFTVNNVPQTSQDGTTNILVSVLGVSYLQAFSVSYTDYGDAQGTRSSSGNSATPLYNASYPAPNSGDWTQAGIPYAQYNSPPGSSVVTVVFPSAVTSPSVTVYYTYSININGNVFTPLDAIPLDFEQHLGSAGGPLSYVDFSGVFGQQIFLGVANIMPNYSFETQGMYGYSPTADCNVADIVADIICSGTNLQGWGGGFPPPVWQHGLNLTSLVAPNAFTGFGSPPYNPSYSRYGGILDDEPNLWGLTYSGGSNPGLNLLRTYSQAAGIFLSFTMDTQQSAAQNLDDLCAIAQTAGCWDGAQLKFIPYCEQSFYGNGASYVSPTSSGPIVTFNDDDYITQDPKGNPQPPLEIERSRLDSNFNSISIEYVDRTTTNTDPGGNPIVGRYDTNHVLISDQADITVQGPMPGNSISYHWIKDVNVASAVGWAIMRRNLLVNRRKYKWQASARFGYLTLMDLILLTESSAPNSPFPVRITKITENPDFSINFEAEPFVYGGSSSFIPGTNFTPPAGQGVEVGNPTAFSGSVNTPVIFETTPSLWPGKPQIWIGVSGADPNYGGCSIWLSTDGGATYIQVGRQFGEQTMGLVYNTNFPSHADPDTVNTLHVDLTESRGALGNFTTTQRDAFQSVCYLSGGGTIGGFTIPYELVCYATATLAAANKYALPPTIRRGVFGTPVAVHNIGAQFSFLEDGEIFQLDIDPNWIGTTLHFKFTAFNTLAGSEQPLSAVTDYTFTPSGLVGWSFSAPGTPTGSQPFPTGGNNPSVGMADDQIFSDPQNLTYDNAMLLYINVPPRNVTFPAGLTNSTAKCITAPTGNITLPIQKNGVTVGTINFAAASNIGTFTAAAGFSFNGTTDEIKVFAPTIKDTSFAGLYFALWATRAN